MFNIIRSFASKLKFAKHRSNPSLGRMAGIVQELGRKWNWTGTIHGQQPCFHIFEMPPSTFAKLNFIAATQTFQPMYQ